MAKADLHVHSMYSNRPSEWVLQRLGASQSYTTPEAVYERAKEAGMSFVTITDHNTFEGSAVLAEKYEDAFTGTQLTTYFADGCKIHLLVWGFTPNQFEEMIELRKNIFALQEYIIHNRIAYSVAHATYILNNTLELGHLEKLVLMFDVFESLNGGQNKNSNNAWYYYLRHLNAAKIMELENRHKITPISDDSWLKGFTGGSDDHANLFIGRTYTMANSGNVEGFLRAIRHKKSFAEGRTNDFQTLAFTVYKIAHEFSKSKGRKLSYTPLGSVPDMIFGNEKPNLIDSLLVLGMKAETGYRRGIADLLSEIRRKKDPSIEGNIDLVYDRIADIVDDVIAGIIESVIGKATTGDLFSLAKEVSAALPGIFLLVPFFTSLKMITHNTPLLDQLRQEVPEQRNRRIIWFTDTLIDLNGPSVTLKNMGWAFYRLGIDVRIVSCLEPEEMTEDLPPNTVNLPYIYKFELPYYGSYKMRIPSVLKAMKELHSFEPDEIFISTPGPMGLLGLVLAKLMSVRAVGVYHTDFTNELNEITEDIDDDSASIVEEFVRWFYNQMDEIKVPTRSYIDILSKRGVSPDKMSIFPRLIDHQVFHRLEPDEWGDYRIPFDQGVNFIYAGRVSKDKNLEFLLDVIEQVWEQRSDVNFSFVGDGPFRTKMEERLAGHEKHVHFFGRVPHDELPKLYSQADALVFPSTTDTFGMVVLEAQCCELPSFVSDIGGPKEIVFHRETGWVLPALNVKEWTDALLGYADLVMKSRDDAETMRAEAGKRARERYGLHAVLKGLTSEELVPRPRELVD
jgi:glycosyltransferase involved in cell wall biosynthesis